MCGECVGDMDADKWQNVINLIWLYKIRFKNAG